mgnify:FL=1
MAYTLEKIDAENFKLIESKSATSVFNINELKKLKTQLENEVTKINNELARVNTILDEYAKLP